MAKQLVLYDLDGTLVDTADDIWRAVNFMLAQMSHPPMSKADVLREVGRGLHELIRRCLNITDDAVVEQGVALYAAYYGEHLLDSSQLFPSALDLLEYFHPRPQAVVTNKPNPYSRIIMEGLGVSAYFGDIVGGEDGYPCKPDPTSVQALMRKYGAEPANTLFVGDSTIDIETGRRAGVFTAVVAHGFQAASELTAAKPDLLVEDLTQLARMVREQRW